METREKLSDKVIVAIKKDIAAGRLKKGEKIPAEHELMEIYEVGRSTIREAVKTLAISGILKVQQGSGTFVASKIKDETLSQRLRRADFDEINSVRSLLEKEIVRLACKNHDSENTEEMSIQLENRKKAILSGLHKKAADADIAFHISIAKASKNNVLSDLYQNFTLVMRSFFAQRDDQGMQNFADSHHLHEALASAIALRDEKLSEQLITNILDNNY